MKTCKRGHQREDTAGDCQECRSERSKQWALDHPDRRRENARKRYLGDAERIRAKNRQWALANADRMRELQKRWREANAGRDLENARQYRAANPEQHRAIWINYKSRKRGDEGRITGDQIKSLHAEQDGRCKICNCDLPPDWHVDHIVPVSRGGANLIGNVQALCPPCNRTKADKLPEELEQQAHLFALPVTTPTQDQSSY